LSLVTGAFNTSHAAPLESSLFPEPDADMTPDATKDAKITRSLDVPIFG
jgi:hypothetical protein